MNTQEKWYVVAFIDDSSVEAVPDIWMKKKSCAWPKLKNNVKKFIEKRIKPNTEEFFFYKARILGNKSYNSLAEARSKLFTATHRSDLSSAEDTMNLKRKIICESLSPDDSSNKKKVKHGSVSNTCPPRYNDYLKGIKNGLEKNKSTRSDDEDSYDDSDIDPTWHIKRQFDNLESNDMNNIDNVTSSTEKINVQNNTGNDFNGNDIIHITPTKIAELNESILQSPSGTWKVTDHRSSQINVKKQLFKGKESPSDFQTLVLSSLTYLKHEINSLMYNIHSINENIESLMKDKSSVNLKNDGIDMESLFPITTESELHVLENKIKDIDFKRVLASKISLLIGNKDLGNTVRRIMMRMFSDQFLVNYSLYGFKKKLSFANLGCYRLIIDAIRVHTKYKSTTEKEIDTPLGTWLSHAPFREKKKKEQDTVNKNNDIENNILNLT